MLTTTSPGCTASELRRPEHDARLAPHEGDRHRVLEHLRWTADLVRQGGPFDELETFARDDQVFQHRDPRG